MKKDNKITYAADFESFYSRECSIKTLGPIGYFSHHDFDAYLVSIVGDNGYKFVGHPKDFDWSLLDGNIVLSHNAAFDESLYMFGVSRGWWPFCSPSKWYCTADMAACCGLPRSLKGATEQAFNLEVSKETRGNMLGKRWEDMTEEFKKEVSDYALLDSELCLRLWEAYESKWSKFEREISRANRKCVQRGIPVNPTAIEEAKVTIAKELHATEQCIPWNGEKPLLSRKAFDEECIKCNITPPKSLAQTDTDAVKWIRKHGKNYRWIRATTNWRRINSIKKKVESFDFGTMSDERYYGGLMYFGGHTGRYSGSGGNLNLQNLPRDKMFGVNMRHFIEARKGHKLIVADLSQIEVRTLTWLAGDSETLTAIADSEDIYEAFAIQFGLWDKARGSLKKEDFNLRLDTKRVVLGCGYGCGPDKFAEIAGYPLKKAKEMVDLYRTKMKKIPAYWKSLNDDIRTCHNAGIDFKVELPSGRVMDYGKVYGARGEYGTQHVVKINRNGKKLPMKVWGGVISENISQGLARDIFCYMLLRLEEEGIKVIFHVHDEFIIECRDEDAEYALAKTLEIMSTPPPWIPDIPLDAEGGITQKYQK